MFRVYRALLRLFLLFILQTSQADKRTESLVYQTLGAQEAQERASDGEGHILAVDSDYLLLRQAASLLPVPGIGLGVFAKAAIRANDIICEFRGPVILAEDLHHFPGDKNFGVVGPGSHSHSHSHSHTHTYTHTPSQSYSHSHTHTLSHSYSHSHTLTLSHSHTHTPTLSHTLSHSQRKCYDGFRY